MRLLTTIAAIVILAFSVCGQPSQDADLKRLMSSQWYDLSVSERTKYAESLIRALRAHPQNPMAPEVHRRIGDVYHNMGETRKMRKWYRKTISLDSTLAVTTPIGYRLKVANKHILRKNLFAAVFVGYAIVAILLGARILVSFRTFDLRFFLKWTAIFLAVFSLGTLLIIAIDYRISIIEAMKLAEDPTNNIAEPIVPLSLAGGTAWQYLLSIPAFGFFPVFSVIMYKSFGSRPGLVWLSSVGLLAALSGWTHFFLINYFDSSMKATGYPGTLRVYFDGELEDVLPSHPDQVFRANPDITKSNNSDLKRFLKEALPAGTLRNAYDSGSSD